jgi:hypothetical protein
MHLACGLQSLIVVGNPASLSSHVDRTSYFESQQ